MVAHPLFAQGFATFAVRRSGPHKYDYAQLGISSIPNWACYGAVVSEKIDAEEMLFRERVRDAIQAGGKSGVMARKTGIPVGTLNKYVSLRSTPSAPNALKIAQAVGLSVEELAAGVAVGEGNREHLLRAGRPTREINPAIFKAVKGMIREINDSQGIRLTEDARESETIRWYNELISMAKGNTDEGKLRSLLGGLEYDIRQSVIEAVAEPGTGKRLA